MSWRIHPGWLLAGILALLLVAAVFGDKGLLRLWDLRGELHGLHRDIQALEADNERLSGAIVELREDPAVVERIAREELGLVRPGERVLRFPPSPRPEEPASMLSPGPPAPPPSP